MPIRTGNVYQLTSTISPVRQGGIPQIFDAIVITPDTVDHKTVTIAWTHAVRFTADGLDKPNWEKALHKLEEFHPSWVMVRGKVAGVMVDVNNQEADQPDPR